MLIHLSTFPILPSTSRNLQVRDHAFAGTTIELYEMIGNIQQPPPLEPDLFLADVYFNPFATQVSSAFLGPRPKFTFLSAVSEFSRAILRLKF